MSGEAVSLQSFGGVTGYLTEGKLLMVGHEVGIPSLLTPSIPRDFLPLEGTDSFPDNDILNDLEKAFSPEDDSHGAHQSRVRV